MHINSPVNSVPLFVFSFAVSPPDLRVYSDGPQEAKRIKKAAVEECLIEFFTLNSLWECQSPTPGDMIIRMV